MDAKVTVVIVNWNGEPFLERCLSALAEQTLKPHDIILVDNASTDRSAAIIQQFPNMRLIALDRNTGFAYANNLAIRLASEASVWIALINTDAFAEPRWLEELLLSAQRNPAFAVFGSRLLKASDPSTLDGVGDVYHMSGLVWRMGHGMPTTAEHEREVFSPCAAAALYRRSALRELDGFDEDYFCYLEDVDLGFRLRLAGYHCLSVPQSVAHHVGSGTTGGQHSDFAIYHGHQSGLDVCEGYAGRPVLAAAAAASDAQSGEPDLVCVARAGTGHVAGQTRCRAWFAEDVAQTSADSEQPPCVRGRDLASTG